MIYRVITCALVGIISHGFIALHLHEKWEDEESLAPTFIALALAVVVELVAWELLGLI